MAWVEVKSGLGQIKPSHSESLAFGFPVGRLAIGESWKNDFDSLELIESRLVYNLENDHNKIVIIRLVSELLPIINRIQFKSRKLYFAGTVVYWELQVLSESFESQRFQQTGQNEYSLSKDKILEAVSLMFDGYQNHYTTNPLLAAVSTSTSYRNWCETIFEERPEHIVVLSEDDQIIGLAVLDLSEEDTVEVLLAGIIPEFQAQGRYSQLINLVIQKANSLNRTKIVISTQSNNISVQRSWARIGFVPRASLETFHLNKL